MKNLVVHLDDELHARFKLKCVKKRITIKQAVTELIEKWSEKD